MHWTSVAAKDSMIHLLVIFALIGPGFCMAVDFGEDNSYPHVEVPSNGFTCESYSSSLCTSEKNESCASVEEECSLHHGLNLACYALWKNNSKDGVKMLLKGCWPSQPEMEQCGVDKCVADKLQTNHAAGAETYFCCCEKSNCNDKVYFQPKSHMKSSTASVVTADSTDDLFTAVVLAFVPIIFIALFIFFFYWMWRRYRFCKLQERANLDPATKTPSLQSSLPPIEWNGVALISRGRYGAVYKTYMGDKLVAVKVFPAQDADSWTQEQDMYQVQALRSHDNILRFIGSEVRGSGPTTEYMLITAFHENGSLYDYLKAHIVTFRELMQISKTMLTGLAFLHEEIMSQGDLCYKPTIVHRDFKSRNVLLKKDLSACVADFGLAVKCEHGRTPKDTHGQVGTRRYMAPEVLEGATEFSAFAFKQIDVYACALVLWEVLSRCAIGNGPVGEYKLPFEEEIGSKPSLAEMQNLVAVQRKRPLMKDSWRANPKCEIVCQTIQEMWDNEFEARVTAGGALERFIQLEPDTNISYSSLISSSNDKHQECTPLITDFSNSSSIV